MSQCGGSYCFNKTTLKMPLSRQKLRNKNGSGPSSQDCSYSLLTHLPQAVAETFKEPKRKASPEELGSTPNKLPCLQGWGWGGDRWVLNL